MKYQAVLFDLDGTILDPFDGFAAAMDAAMDALGRPRLSDAEMRPLIGPPLAFSLEALVGPDLLDPAITAYRRHYKTTGLFASRLYDGMRAALATLHAAGLVLVLATSKPTDSARRLVDHYELSDFFFAVEGADGDGDGAIKANVVARALAHLTPQQRANCVMVGDRFYDVEGAQIHGVACIGVNWGYAAPNELVAAGALAVAETPQELLEHLL